MDGATIALRGLVFLDGQTDHAGTLVSASTFVSAHLIWLSIVCLVAGALLLVRRRRGVAGLVALLAASVAFAGSWTSTSDSTGTYEISVPAAVGGSRGTIVLHYSHAGYRPETQSVVIESGGPDIVTVGSATLFPLVGATPSATEAAGSPTATATEVVFVTATPTDTHSRTVTATPTDTATPLATATETSTATATSTNTPTSPGTETPSTTATQTETASAASTTTPTVTPTRTSTRTASSTPTQTATSIVSATPTRTTTSTPTHTATSTVTSTPTRTATPTSTKTPCAVDTDGDRLCNAVETNTGQYISPTDTGTNPNNNDTDGDGLRDGDEVLGTVAGLGLPAFGVSPVHKDVLFEYDWFDDANGCAAHTHRPSVGATTRVTDAFAAAPVTNPDGATGITAHHDFGQGGGFTGGNLVPDADGVLTFGVNSTEFNAIKAANFASNRKGFFHYVVLPHRYNTTSGSSGQAELPGDDLIVSLQCSTTDRNVANTIVHEVGHNFGLRHGGNVNCNYKPNYNSVMNYRFQFPGVDTNCVLPGDGLLSYSPGTRLSLDENALDENVGMCGSPPIDWDGDSVIENNVQVDLNASDTGEAITCGGVLTVLQDSNDFAALNYAAIRNGDRASQEIISCDNPAPP